MFAVASQCTTHSFFFVSLITAEDAMRAAAWYNDDFDRDNVFSNVFSNVPTMMFTNNILCFQDFAWVKANITATRSVTSAWRYGPGREMLPPRPETPTTWYNCVGFGPAFTPKLVRKPGPAHPRSIRVIGDIFQIAILHRRTRHIHVTLEEWEPFYPVDNAHDGGDNARGGPPADP